MQSQINRHARRKWHMLPLFSAFVWIVASSLQPSLPRDLIFALRRDGKSPMESNFPTDWPANATDWEAMRLRFAPRASTLRSNKSRVVTDRNGRAALTLLPQGDGVNAKAARTKLAALLRLQLETSKDNMTLFQERRNAFKALMDTDNEVRRGWNRRLAKAAPRGIAICAGGDGPLANAFAVLHVVRNVHNCTLPVVIMHWGRAEIPEAAEKALLRHITNLTFFDLSTPGVYPYSHHIALVSNASMAVAEGPKPLSKEKAEEAAAAAKAQGYLLKVAAIYAAPFREVLMLDSDSLPLQDPTPLFSSKPFREHGSMFWPDFWEDRPGLWKALGLWGQDPWSVRQELARMMDPAPAHHADNDEDLSELVARRRRWNRNDNASVAEAPRQTESGQILLDRARHWEVLEWVLFLNSHHSLVYGLPDMLGDKDTFAVAFALAEAFADFWQVPHAPAMPAIDRVSALDRQQEPRFIFSGMVQLHPLDGSPMFHHRTAHSKLPGRGRLGPMGGPITHVSTPASQGQARSITAWRANVPGWVWKLWRSEWGLLSDEVQTVKCEGYARSRNTSSGGGSALRRNLTSALPKKSSRGGGRSDPPRRMLLLEEDEMERELTREHAEWAQEREIAAQLERQLDGEAQDRRMWDRKWEEELQCPAGCSIERLAFVDMRCSERSMDDKEYSGLPVTMVAVPLGSRFGKASLGAAEAHALFQKEMGWDSDPLHMSMDDESEFMGGGERDYNEDLYEGLLDEGTIKELLLEDGTNPDALN